MVDSLIRVASKFNQVQVVDDQMKQRIQREYKLKQLKKAKEKSLKKAEREYIQANIWFEQYQLLT